MTTKKAVEYTRAEINTIDETGPLPSFPWAAGRITLKRPMILPFNTGAGGYDKESWKARLAAAYGKRGRALSRALIREGYDCIVTFDKDNDILEVVILTN